MILKELIQILEASCDRHERVRRGFHQPHSYRGYYSELAFEPAENVTIQSMLDCAKEALGSTYTGWKGGDYVMNEYSDVYLANIGSTGEELGKTLLLYMLGDVVVVEEGSKPELNPRGPKTKAELWRQMAGYIEKEGLHYALVNYTSPEYQNCDQLDPELAKMWRDFIALSAAIEQHVGYPRE